MHRDALAELLARHLDDDLRAAALADEPRAVQLPSAMYCETRPGVMLSSRANSDFGMMEGPASVRLAPRRRILF